MTNHKRKKILKKIEDHLSRFMEDEPRYNPRTLVYLRGFHFTPFNSEVHVCHVSKLDANGYSIAWSKNNSSLIVLNSELLTPKNHSHFIDVVVHEVWQTVHYLLDDCYKLKADNNCKELYAYYLGLLSGLIHKSAEPYFVAEIPK
jgi:hypothetical protein